MVAWWCSKANKIWLRVLAVVVSSVFFFTQVVGASVPDRSFWAERRKARQKLLASREKPHQSDRRESLGEKLEEKDVAGEVSSLITPHNLFTVPSQYGTVREVHTQGSSKEPQGMGNRLIIHIQDAHSSPEAQLNSANILKYLRDSLAQTSGVSSESLTREDETIVSHSRVDGVSSEGLTKPLLICVEGSSGLIDTTLLSSFPEEKVKEEVASEFLKEGKITGEEYFAIIKDEKAPVVNIYGVEDKRAYEKNLKAFDEGISSGEKIRNYFQKVQEEINPLKARLYNKRLKDLESKIEAYQKKKISLSQYCQYLHRLLDDAGSMNRTSTESNVGTTFMTPKRYPNFRLFVEASQFEEKIDFSRVDSERSKYIKELSEKLTNDELSELLIMSLDYRLGKVTSGEYYTYLQSLSSRMGKGLRSEDPRILTELVTSKEGKNEYPNLNLYIKYNKLYDRIDQNKLFSEINELEEELKEGLCETEEERQLVKLSRMLGVLEDLVSLKISNEDLAYYYKHRDEITSGMFSNFITESNSRLTLRSFDTPNEFLECKVKALLKFEEFYRIALSRNEALVDNTISRMEKEGAKVAVLIAGGFHTPGITELLRDRNISYVVVTPRLGEGYSSDLEISPRKKRTDFEKAIAGIMGALRPASLLVENQSFKILSAMQLYFGSLIARSQLPPAKIEKELAQMRDKWQSELGDLAQLLRKEWQIELDIAELKEMIENVAFLPVVLTRGKEAFALGVTRRRERSLPFVFKYDLVEKKVSEVIFGEENCREFLSSGSFDNKKEDQVVALGKLPELWNFLSDASLESIAKKILRIPKGIPKIVFFDLDGVLFRTPTNRFDTPAKILSKYGVEISAEQLEEITHPSEEWFRKVMLGEITEQELITYINQKLREFGLKKDLTIDEFFEIYFCERTPNEKFYPLLRKLKSKGIKLGIISDRFAGDPIVFRKKLDASFPGIFEREDLIFFSCEKHLSKQSIALFELAKNAARTKFDIKPEEILFVDDNEKFINVAQSAGLEALQYVFYDEEAPEPASYEIFRDILALPLSLENNLLESKKKPGSGLDLADTKKDTEKTSVLGLGAATLLTFGLGLLEILHTSMPQTGSEWSLFVPAVVLSLYGLPFLGTFLTSLFIVPFISLKGKKDAPELKKIVEESIAGKRAKEIVYEEFSGWQKFKVARVKPENKILYINKRWIVESDWAFINRLRKLILPIILAHEGVHFTINLSLRAIPPFIHFLNEIPAYFIMPISFLKKWSLSPISTRNANRPLYKGGSDLVKKYGGRFAGWISLLRSKNHYFQDMAKSKLIRMGKSAIPVLQKALEDDYACVRQSAAEALGEIGPEAKEAVPALEKALEGDDLSFVREAVAKALTKITGKDYTKQAEAQDNTLNNGDSFDSAFGGEGKGKGDFLAFDKGVSDEDADRLARENAIGGKIKYKKIGQAIRRIGRGRGKISFGKRGRNNQRVGKILASTFKELKRQNVQFKFSKGFGRYVNRVDNIVYLDEVLREAFQKRPPPARLVQLFAFLAHQGSHNEIFEPDNLPKEFTEEAYAGLAELEIYILAGKALREKLRRTVKSDLAKQNISWDNVILDELFDLADEYDITTPPMTLEFYHDGLFTYVGKGKFVSQIVLSCRENLIPENLRELYTYLRTQERQGKIESSEVGSTILGICENLTRRGYDKQGVEELKRLIENKDWEELTTSFFREVTFGTAGIRGVRGRPKDTDTSEEGQYLPGPNRINPDTIKRYTIGVANYILNHGLKEQGVVVARDTRIGSRRFTEEVIKVLRRKGIKVFRFEADRPVAEMALAVVELGAALGIEVTAIHNPQSDNGYRISNEFGAQLFGPEKRAIVVEIERVEIEDVDDLKLDEFDPEKDRNNHPDLHRIIGGSDTDRNMDRVYKDRVTEYILNPRIVQENAPKVRIAYDPLYGAGRNIVYELLKNELGFDVQRYEPHSVSDGRFPGLPKNPDPAEEGILDEVTNWADTLGEIDFILGTDPDSDRAAFRVKDGDGKWRLLKANDVWSLLVWYRLTQLKAMKESDTLPDIYKDIHQGKVTGKDMLTDGYVIETWVTTDLIEAIVNSFGLSTEFRPKVGFSAIAEVALDKIALPVLCERYALNLEDVLNHYKEEGVQYIAERLARSRRDVLQEIFAILRSRLLGGFEESNGVSFGGHTLEKDGLLASVAVAEIAAYAKSQNTTLYELLNRIYLEYGYYATQNIPLKLDELTGNAEKKKILESLGQKLIEVNQYRGTEEALKIGSSEIIEARSGREITHMDEEGYKFSLSDTDWVIPRPSGTEPKIRFYGQVKVDPSLLTQENIEQEKQKADQRAENLVKQAQEFATRGILTEEPISKPLKESFILNFIKSLKQRAEEAGYPVNEQTKFSLLIGGHVKTSPSFRIVNYLLQLAEENVVYLPYEISSEKELEELIQILRESPRLVELIISDPYKICALNYVDELAESAKKAQAVNNIVITRDNKLLGSMFDGLAFIYWWKDILGKSLDNKKIIHLGAGGVARAFAAAVSEEASNVEFVFSDVSGRRLYTLKDIIESWGKNIKVKIIKVAPGSESEELNKELTDADIVVNGTGLGKTKGNIYAYPRLDYTRMKGKVCIDWNYRPAAKNLFLKYSQDNGATIYNALGFLITGFYYTLGAISDKTEVFDFDKLLRFAKDKLGFKKADEADFEGDARMVKAREALAECLPVLAQLSPLGLIKETKRRLSRPEIPFIEQVIVILDSLFKQDKSFAWDVLKKLRDYFSVTGWGILSNAIEYHLPDLFPHPEEESSISYSLSVPEEDRNKAISKYGIGITDKDKARGNTVVPHSLISKIQSIRKGFKVALIGPSQLNLETNKRYEMISTPFLPIGVNAVMGHLLERQTEIKAFDPNNPKELEELFEYVKAQDVILGISPLHDTLQFDLQLLDKLQEKVNRYLVVAGGIEASTNDKFFLKNHIVDIVFSGPSEYPFKEFLEFLESKRDVKEIMRIKGIKFYDGETVRSTGKISYSSELFEETIRKFPWEKMGLVDFVKERSLEIRLPVSFLLCSDKCKFCSVPAFRRTFRCLSRIITIRPDLLVEMIEKISYILSSAGIDPNKVTFYLQDENFFAHPSRVKKFIQALKKAKEKGRIPKGYSFSVKANVGFRKEDIYKELGELNFTTLGIGIEHWDNDVLAGMNKRFTTEEAEEMFKMMLKYGITPTVFLIIFPPGSNLISATKTLNKAKEWKDLGCDVKLNLFVSAYPETRFLKEYEDNIVHKEVNYREKKYLIPWIILPNDPTLLEKSIKYINTSPDKNFNFRLGDFTAEELIAYFSGKTENVRPEHRPYSSEILDNRVVIRKMGKWVLADAKEDGYSFTTAFGGKGRDDNSLDNVGSDATAHSGEVRRGKTQRGQQGPLEPQLISVLKPGLHRERNLQLEKELASLIDQEGQRALTQLLKLISGYTSITNSAQDEIYHFIYGFIEDLPELLRTYRNPAERLAAIRKKISDLEKELAKDRENVDRTRLVLRNLWAWYSRIILPDKPTIRLSPDYIGSYSLDSLPKGIKDFRIEGFNRKDKKLMQEWESWARRNSDGTTEERYLVNLLPKYFHWVDAIEGRIPGFKLISIDSQGKKHIEGWVVFDEIHGEGLIVAYRENAPWNRIDNPRRIKGVATLLEKRVIEEAIRKGYNGRVFSIPETKDGIRFALSMGAIRAYQPKTQYGNVSWWVYKLAPEVGADRAKTMRDTEDFSDNSESFDTAFGGGGRDDKSLDKGDPLDAAEVHSSVVVEPQEKYEKFKPLRLQATLIEKNHLNFKITKGSITQGARDRFRRRTRAIKYLPKAPPKGWTQDILITPDTTLTKDGKRHLGEIVDGEIRYYPVVLEKDKELADLFNSSPIEAQRLIESVILKEILSALKKDYKVLLSCLPTGYISANFKILSPFNQNKVSCSEAWYRQIKQRFVSLEVDLSKLSGRIKGGLTRYARLLQSKTYANVQKIVADKTRDDAYGFESRDRGIFGPTVEEARYAIEAKIKEWHDMGIRVMLHCGIGGQALGNRTLLEPATYNLGWEVIVLEKLGYDFNQIFDALEKKGISASQICMHVSSKSGTTDETMINFQAGLKTLIMRLSKEKFGDERVGLELIGILGGLDDLAKLGAEEVEGLNLSDKAKTLLRELFRRIIFTTTLGEEKGSRLYAFARCKLVRSILGPAGIPVVGIPDNIGGRFSERSPSGDVTSSFAGRDISKISQGAHEVLDIYTSTNPNINLALKAACYLYLLNPDYIVVAVQVSNMRAVASALAQKFPESWGKGGIGPMVLVCTGQKVLDKMAQAMENYRAAFILINVTGEKVKPLVLKDPNLPCLIYTQMGLGEKEEARRLLFSDELTKWFGELNAAAVTEDYRSSIYQPFDFQTQPFVDIGKKLMEETARNLSRDEISRSERYSRFFAQGRRFPQLFRSRGITTQNILTRMLTLREDLGSLTKDRLPKETNRQEDEQLLACIKQIKKLMAEQAHCRSMRGTHKIDNKIYEQFARIAEYGSNPQPAYIEKPALVLALLCADHIIRGKIPLPIFYTHQVEAEILGRWYKYIMQNVPNEYGIGTREQHSYFQSLLGGKDVALPILVDVFTPLERVRQTQEPIWYIGLAKDYLKGLYPDEVRRLYLEAEFDAFVSEKVPEELRDKIRRKDPRDCAILRIWDLSTDTGLIEAFRFFGRFNALLSKTVSLLHQEISIDGRAERLRATLEEEEDQNAGQIIHATDEMLGTVLRNPRLLNLELLEALSRQPIKVAQAIWRKGGDKTGLKEWHTRTSKRDVKQLLREIRQPYVLWNKINMLQRLETKRILAEQWLEINRKVVSELINIDAQVAKNHLALFSLLFNDQGLPVYLNGAPQKFVYHQVSDDSEYRKELKGVVPGRNFRLRGTLEYPLNEPRGYLGFEPPINKESFLRLKLNRFELTKEDIKSFSKLAMAECIQAVEFFAPLVHSDKPLILHSDFIEMVARAGISIPKKDLTISKFLQLVKPKGPSSTTLSSLGIFAIPSLAEAAGITVQQIQQILELAIIVGGVGIIIWLVWDYIKGEREIERETDKLLSSFKSKVKSEIDKLLSSFREVSHPVILKPKMSDILFVKGDVQVLFSANILEKLAHMTKISRKLRVELMATVKVKDGRAQEIEYCGDDRKIAVVKADLPASTRMNPYNREDPKSFYFPGTENPLFRLFNWAHKIKRKEDVLNSERQKELKDASKLMQEQFSFYRSIVDFFSISKNRRVEIDSGVAASLPDKSDEELFNLSVDLRNLSLIATEWIASEKLIPIMEEPVSKESLPKYDQKIYIHTHPKEYACPPSAIRIGDQEIGDVFVPGFFAGEISGLILDTKEGDELFLLYEADASNKQKYQDMFGKFWQPGHPSILEDLREVAMKPTKHNSYFLTNHLTKGIKDEAEAIGDTKDSSDKGSSKKEQYGADKCACLGKDKRLSTREIGQRAKANILKLSKEEIKKIIQLWIETRRYWDLRSEIDNFIKRGRKIEISSQFGALSVRVGNTIYLDKIFRDVSYEGKKNEITGSISGELKAKMHLVSFLFGSVIANELADTSKRGSLKEQFIEEALAVIEELRKLDHILLDKNELVAFLKQWAIQNEMEPEDIVIDEGLPFMILQDSYSKQFLLKAIDLVRDVNPEFKEVGDAQNLWKDLAIAGFEKSNEVEEMGCWIDALTEIMKEDKNKISEIIELFDRYFIKLDKYSGWPGRVVSDNVVKILGVYGDIGGKKGLDGLRKALGYSFVADRDSAVNKVWDILLSQVEDIPKLREMVLTYISAANRIGKICDLVIGLSKRKEGLIDHQVVASLVKRFAEAANSIWHNRQDGLVGLVVWGGLGDEWPAVLSGLYSLGWGKIISFVKDNPSVIEGQAWQKLAEEAFLEILGHSIEISKNGIAVFNLFIGTKGIEEICSLPNKFVEYHVHDEGTSRWDKEGESLINSALRGSIGFAIDLAKGFIRIDPPSEEKDKDAYLKRKLDKKVLTGKDKRKYEEIVVQDIIQAVSLLAQRANPDKELKLVDSVKEMFKNQGIFLPERLTIKTFTEAVETPEKYKPERKVKPPKAVKFKEVRTPTYARYRFRITKPEGLHMKVAIEIVKLMENFKGKVTITKEKDKRTANAGSIDELIMLAAGPGSTVIIEAKGEDALNVASAVEGALKGKTIETAFGGERRRDIEFREEVGTFKTGVSAEKLPLQLQGIFKIFQRKTDIVMQRVNNFVRNSGIIADYKEHKIIHQLIEFIDEPKDEQQALRRKSYFPRENWKTERPYELVVWISRDVLENITSINNPKIRDLVIDAMVLEACMHFYPGYNAFDILYDRETWKKSKQGQERIASELDSLAQADLNKEVNNDRLSHLIYQLALSFLPFNAEFIRGVEDKLGYPIDWTEVLTHFSRRGPVETNKRARNVIETKAAEFFYYICYTDLDKPQTEQEFREAFQERFIRYYEYNFWMDMPAYEEGFEQGKTYEELIEEKAVELFNDENRSIAANRLGSYSLSTTREPVVSFYFNTTFGGENKEKDTRKSHPAFSRTSSFEADNPKTENYVGRATKPSEALVERYRLLVNKVSDKSKDDKGVFNRAYLITFTVLAAYLAEQRGGLNKELIKQFRKNLITQLKSANEEQISKALRNLRKIYMPMDNPKKSIANGLYSMVKLADDKKDYTKVRLTTSEPSKVFLLVKYYYFARSVLRDERRLKQFWTKSIDLADSVLNVYYFWGQEGSESEHVKWWMSRLLIALKNADKLCIDEAKEILTDEIYIKLETEQKDFIVNKLWKMLDLAYQGKDPAQVLLRSKDFEKWEPVNRKIRKKVALDIISQEFSADELEHLTEEMKSPSFKGKVEKANRPVLYLLLRRLKCILDKIDARNKLPNKFPKPNKIGGLSTLREALEHRKIIELITSNDIRWPSGERVTPEDVRKHNIVELLLDDSGGYCMSNLGWFHLQKMVGREGERYYLMTVGSMPYNGQHDTCGPEEIASLIIDSVVLRSEADRRNARKVLVGERYRSQALDVIKEVMDILGKNRQLIEEKLQKQDAVGLVLKKFRKVTRGSGEWLALRKTYDVVSAGLRHTSQQDSGKTSDSPTKWLRSLLLGGLGILLFMNQDLFGAVGEIMKSGEQAWGNIAGFPFGLGLWVILACAVAVVGAQAIYREVSLARSDVVEIEEVRLPRVLGLEGRPWKVAPTRVWQALVPLFEGAQKFVAAIFHKPSARTQLRMSWANLLIQPELSEEEISRIRALAEKLRRGEIARLWTKRGPFFANPEINPLWTSPGEEIAEEVRAIEELAEKVKERHDYVVVIGRAVPYAKVAKGIGEAKGYPQVLALNPEALNEIESEINLEKTLFVVSSPVPGEGYEEYKHFYSELTKFYKAQGVSAEEITSEVGRHFVGIGEANRPFVKEAREKEFLKVFSEESGVSRSIFSYEGLVPLALAGVNIERFLESSKEGKAMCREENFEKNPGMQLAKSLEKMMEAGRQIVLVLPEEMEGFGEWWQELVESLWGEEVRITAITERELSGPESYGKNVAFIHLNVGATFMTPQNVGLMNRTPTLSLLKEAGYPVFEVPLRGEEAIGELSYIAEHSTALSYLMRIDKLRGPGGGETAASAEAAGYQPGEVLSQVAASFSLRKVEPLSEYPVNPQVLEYNGTKVFVFDFESLFDIEPVRKATPSRMSIEFRVKPKSKAVFKIMEKIVKAGEEENNPDGVKFAPVSSRRYLNAGVMEEMLRDYMSGYGLGTEVISRVIDSDFIIDRKQLEDNGGIVGITESGKIISTKAVFNIINEKLLLSGKSDGNGTEIKIITDSESRWAKDGTRKMMERILWVLLEPAKEGEMLSTAAGLVVAIEGRVSQWLIDFIKATYSEEEAKRLLSRIVKDGKIILPPMPVDKEYLEGIESEARIYKVQA